jgi:ATP-dependent DNA ligase
MAIRKKEGVESVRKQAHILSGDLRKTAAQASLPIQPVYLPMEAVQVSEIPIGSQWQYEPKWDGFRCLVFRDGDRVELQSKSGQPMARYFPELVTAVRNLEPRQFVLDSEIVFRRGAASPSTRC